MCNMHNEPSPELLTSEQTAAELDIDRSTLSRWVASGRLVPAVKAPGLRGARFFTREAVEAAREGAVQ